MEVRLKLENLEKIVETALNENLETVITNSVNSLAENAVQKNAKVIIEKIVNRELSKYIRRYIETATITIGGGWNENLKTFTVKEYLQNQINECLETRTFQKKDAYGVSNISFEDFVKKQINMNGEIEKKLQGFAKEIGKDVSENINQVFTESTKNVLSETVLQVLTATETYKNISNQVKMIASENDND